MKSHTFYLLNKNGNPKPTKNMRAVERFLTSKDRIVKKTTIPHSSLSSSPIEVSTVFLVINHSILRTDPPTLWETMIFGGPLDLYQTRCSGTREQAEAMHAEALKKLRELDPSIQAS